MREWWETHYKLLIASGLRREDIMAVVDSGKIKLRPGIHQLFSLANEKEIPIIIISASGIGEVIPELLDKAGILFDNVLIITNSFSWDENGRAIKINEPIIHSLNKDESVLKHFPITESLTNRRNIILLGDSIDDVKMSHGFNADNVLKIGFLNDKVEERLEDYKKAYDVVITNDGSLEFVNSLLREVIK